MAQLGEFVGALLADAVQARVRADLEALKVAEAYSSHELLRHFPVPRFRVPDITVDFPVVVTGLGGKSTTSPSLFQPPTSGEIGDIVRRSIADSGAKLNTQQRSAIVTVAQERNTALFKKKETAILRSHQIANELAVVAAAAADMALADHEDRAKLVLAIDASVRSGTRRLLAQKITQSPHLQVAVSSSEIKGHGDNESVVRVRLTITEDAFELVEREDGGYSLVPE
jgi:hypothetical protein